MLLKAPGMRTKIIAAMLFLALSGWTQAFALSGLHGAGPTSPASHSHSCCPSLHGSYFHTMVAPAAPASLPCGGEHSCCFGRDSNSPVTVTATSRVERPESRIAFLEAVETAASQGFALARVQGTASLQFYSRLSTILRN